MVYLGGSRVSCKKKSIRYNNAFFSFKIESFIRNIYYGFLRPSLTFLDRSILLLRYLYFFQTNLSSRCIRELYVLISRLRFF